MPRPGMAAGGQGLAEGNRAILAQAEEGKGALCFSRAGQPDGGANIGPARAREGERGGSGDQGAARCHPSIPVQRVEPGLKALRGAQFLFDGAAQAGKALAQGLEPQARLRIARVLK